MEDETPESVTIAVSMVPEDMYEGKRARAVARVAPTQSLGQAALPAPAPPSGLRLQARLCSRRGLAQPRAPSAAQDLGRLH